MADIRKMAKHLRELRESYEHLMQITGALKHTLEAIAEQPRNGDWVEAKLAEAGIEIEGEEE